MRSLIAIAITAAGLALGGCYERPAPDLAMVPRTIEQQAPGRCYANDPYGMRGRIPC
jgi:hypothetical protein